MRGGVGTLAQHFALPGRQRVEIVHAAIAPQEGVERRLVYAGQREICWRGRGRRVLLRIPRDKPAQRFQKGLRQTRHCLRPVYLFAIAPGDM